MVARTVVYTHPPGETPAGANARRQKALNMAERAVALDPNSADTLAERGEVRQNVSWDWEGARKDLERARTIAPGSAHVARLYAHFLRLFGRQDEAIRTYRLAVELDPLYVASWVWLGWAHLNQGQYSSARSEFQRAIELSPSSNEWSMWGIALSYLLEGQIPPAAIWIGKLTGQDENLRLGAMQCLEYARGHRQEAKVAMDELIARSGSSQPIWIAELFAWEGEPDRAFEWLDRAYEAHDNGLEYLKLEKALEKLHGDQRWAALLKKMKLPPD